MVSYKNLFLIKGLSCWNWTASVVSQTWSRIFLAYEGVCNWFHPDSSSWYLYPNQLFPIPYSHYYRLGTSEWKYVPDRQELIYLPSQGVPSQGKASQDEPSQGKASQDEGIYHVSWLSARVSTPTQSVDMDGFLQTLRICSSHIVSVPSSVLLQAWSIYDKQWWLAISDSRLEWIDDKADEGVTPCSHTVSVPVNPNRRSLHKN